MTWLIRYEIRLNGEERKVDTHRPQSHGNINTNNYLHDGVKRDQDPCWWIQPKAILNVLVDALLP